MKLRLCMRSYRSLHVSTLMTLQKPKIGPVRHRIRLIIYWFLFGRALSPNKNNNQISMWTKNCWMCDDCLLVIVFIIISLLNYIGFDRFVWPNDQSMTIFLLIFFSRFVCLGRCLMKKNRSMTSASGKFKCALQSIDVIWSGVCVFAECVNRQLPVSKENELQRITRRWVDSVRCRSINDRSISIRFVCVSSEPEPKWIIIFLPAFAFYAHAYTRVSNTRISSKWWTIMIINMRHKIDFDDIRRGLNDFDESQLLIISSVCLFLAHFWLDNERRRLSLSFSSIFLGMQIEFGKLKLSSFSACSQENSIAKI